MHLTIRSSIDMKPVEPGTRCLTAAPAACSLGSPGRAQGRMVDPEILFRTALEQIPLPERIKELAIARFESPQQFFGSRPSQLRAAGLDPDQAGLVRDFRFGPIEAKLASVLAQGVQCTWPGRSCYPPLLAEIGAPPRLLFLRGRYPRTAEAVAIVGSRRASPYGKDVARSMSRELSEAGLWIASGAARGIDACAHRSSLEAGGRTVAVLGCGIDVAYPREHRRLLDGIAEQGAVLSEFPPGTPPRPHNFPRRNRLISGLSRIVIIIEGRKKSGSLITARQALDQDRQVVAVPHDLGAVGGGGEGPNRLIHRGEARLIRSAEDVLEELAPEVRAALVPTSLKRGSTPRSKRGDAFSDTLRPFYQLLAGRSARTPDELADEVGWPVSRVLSELSILELEGLVEKLPGLRYRLRRGI